MKSLSLWSCSAEPRDSFALRPGPALHAALAAAASRGAYESSRLLKGLPVVSFRASPTTESHNSQGWKGPLDII